MNKQKVIKLDENGGIEKSATLSWPETARLVLLNPELFQFDEIEENSFENCGINKKQR